MKKTIIATLLLITAATAETLNCKTVLFKDQNYGVFADKVEMRCKGSKSGFKTKAVIDGLGAGMRIEAFRGSKLICPFRNGPQVIDEYYGVKVEGTALVGLAGGLFYNTQQSCVLAGVNLGGIGISFTGVRLSIEKAGL